MDSYLTQTKDPRAVGGEMKWIRLLDQVRDLGLEEEYDYNK